ncbi:hypothetical protein Golax_018450 [Gossypium laxum]|uniref:Secreted protein n=1 Tax=Gossypium laxum TaxID=34288 RepID=A0A7J8Z3D7_9ROSI|nr:hypothetical protein [Gossypium laxum]
MGKDYPVGPMLLGFFVFVVIGSSRSHNVCCFTGEYSNFVRTDLNLVLFSSSVSALFQIIRTATSGGMA